MPVQVGRVHTAQGCDVEGGADNRAMIYGYLYYHHFPAGGSKVVDLTQSMNSIMTIFH